jgi:protein tyrosine/serine phosphatase
MRALAVRLGKLVGAVLLVVLAVGVGAGAWAGYLQLTGNIHEVEAGAVYRSNQLSPEDMAALVKTKGIKTVLNLRGKNGDEPWHRAEAAAVMGAGANLIDLTMSANNAPSDALLSELVATLRTAPQPILIHCRGGSDRSGLAAALYELLVVGKSADEAAGQLSFLYGHFPWLGSETGAMDRTFWRVAHGEVKP